MTVISHAGGGIWYVDQVCEALPPTSTVHFGGIGGDGQPDVPLLSATGRPTHACVSFISTIIFIVVMKFDMIKLIHFHVGNG